ncbi:Unknown protein, partial [Striga hermonthica]
MFNTFAEKVQVTTSLNVTKLIAHDSVDEIRDFWTRYSTSNLKLKSYTSNSKTVVKTELDELLSGEKQVSSVYALFETKEPKTMWVCALIDSIVDNWWYFACRSCSSKMINSDNGFKCPKCSKEAGKFRYKMNLLISDATANETFVCWDKESEILIGKPCHALRSESLRK